jgi:hypothetical protein
MIKKLSATIAVLFSFSQPVSAEIPYSSDLTADDVRSAGQRLGTEYCRIMQTEGKRSHSQFKPYILSSKDKNLKQAWRLEWAIFGSGKTMDELLAHGSYSLWWAVLAEAEISTMEKVCPKEYRQFLLLQHDLSIEDDSY